jgi:hypothetical protein
MVGRASVGTMSNFRQVDCQTGFLLPPSVDEWLSERHLAQFVDRSIGPVADGEDPIAGLVRRRRIETISCQRALLKPRPWVAAGPAPGRLKPFLPYSPADYKLSSCIL